MTEQLCAWTDAGPGPEFDSTPCGDFGTAEVTITIGGATLGPRLYCERHAILARALDAMHGIRADLIRIVHEWVAGRATVEDVRAVAESDVAARAQVRRVLPNIPE